MKSFYQTLLIGLFFCISGKLSAQATYIHLSDIKEIGKLNNQTETQIIIVSQTKDISISHSEGDEKGEFIRQENSNNLYELTIPFNNTDITKGFCKTNITIKTKNASETIKATLDVGKRYEISCVEKKRTLFFAKERDDQVYKQDKSLVVFVSLMTDLTIYVDNELIVHKGKIGNSSNIEVKINDIDNLTNYNLIFKTNTLDFNDSPTFIVQEPSMEKLEVHVKKLEAIKTQIYRISKIDNNDSPPIQYTAEIKTVDKNGKPISCLLQIKATGKEIDRTLQDGSYKKIVLPSSGETELIISFRNFDEKKTIKISPGDKPPPIKFSTIDIDNLSIGTPTQAYIEIKVYDKDKYPLSSIYIKNSVTGKTEYLTNSDGVYPVKIPTSGEITFVVSHPDYEETHYVIVKAGDKEPKKVFFEKLKPKTVPPQSSKWKKNYDNKGHNNYLGWAVLDIGVYPRTADPTSWYPALGTSIVARHGLGDNLGFGLGYFFGAGIALGGKSPNYENRFIVPFHYYGGVKLMFRNAFASVGYGTLGCKQMFKSNDSENGQWNTNGYRQGHGLVFTLGYDFLGDLVYQTGRFFSPSIGLAYDVVTKKTQFIANFKLGFAINL